MDKGDGKDIHTMSRTRDNSTYATAAYAAHGQTAAEHRVTKNPKGPLLYIFGFLDFFCMFLDFLGILDFFGFFGFLEFLSFFV